MLRSAASVGPDAFTRSSRIVNGWHLAGPFGAHADSQRIAPKLLPKPFDFLGAVIGTRAGMHDGPIGVKFNAIPDRDVGKGDPTVQVPITSSASSSYE